MNNTVSKSYEILKLISQHSEGLTLAQIVKALELPKSSVFSIVHSLQELGMLRVAQGPVPIYQIGIETLKLGLSYLSGSSLDTVARPILSKLCHDTNETAFLSVPSGQTDIVYVMKFLSDSEYQTKYSVGDVRPFLSLAMGKAILSAMPDQQIRTIITSEQFASCSIPSITDMESLLDYVHHTRQLGYAVDATDENAHFASPVAAPVLDISSTPVAAISLVIMKDPADKARVHALGQRVNAAALEISRGLGYLQESLYSLPQY